MGNATTVTKDLALEIIQRTQELEHAQSAARELSSQVSTLQSKHSAVGDELQRKQSELQQIESQVEQLTQQLAAEQEEQRLTLQQKRLKQVGEEINQRSTQMQSLLLEFAELSGVDVSAFLAQMPSTSTEVGSAIVFLSNTSNGE